MDLEKTYNKWQCTDIEEKYINNIEPTQFTKSELFSFAEYYHQSKVNNGVLDDVIPPLNDSFNRSKKQNERMRKWFEERTGLKDALLIEHMNKIDEMLNVV